MSGSQGLKSLRLQATLTRVRDQVRAEPADARHRIYLFQLLAAAGEWTKASDQLDVLANLDDSLLALVQTYRLALDCERTRENVFAGQGAPLGFGPPSAWMAQLVEALRLSQTGQRAAGQAMRNTAFEEAPTTEGTIDGAPFAWIADSDVRFGPTLEAFLRGQYFLIPFERLSRVQIEPPTDLRDVVWLPAYLTFSNHGEAPALIPARYPGSYRSGEDALSLGQRTEWLEPEPGHFEGVGQRMIATDTGQYPLLEAREIVLETAISSTRPG